VHRSLAELSTLNYRATSVLSMITDPIPPDDEQVDGELMAHKSTLAERVQIVVDAGYTQAQLARLAKVSTSAVTQWLNGGTKTLKAEVALALQRGTGFSADWLVSGKPPQKVQQAFPPLAGFTGTNIASPTHVSGGAMEGAGPTRTRVPVMYAAKLSAGGSVDLSSIEGGAGYVYGFGLSDQAYAMKVRGDELHPVIRDGQIVLMDPQVLASPGDFVVMRDADGKTCVRELLFRRDDSITVASVTGGDRATYTLEEVEFVHTVVAQLAASMLQR
jgi:phage repressor protein C with HTH and peptisase S24 domain